MNSECLWRTTWAYSTTAQFHAAVLVHVEVGEASLVSVGVPPALMMTFNPCGRNRATVASMSVTFEPEMVEPSRGRRSHGADRSHPPTSSHLCSVAGAITRTA